MLIKLSPKIIEALNNQINKEFTAAYNYLALAVYFDEQNLPGFAHWMRVHRSEEDSHGMRLYNFLLEHNAKVDLQPIEKPRSDFGSPVEVFEYILQHEHEVTTHVFELYELAMEEKAHTVKVELEWFITEQAEEEKVVNTILEQLRMVQSDPAGVLVLDRELAQRSLTEEMV